VPHHFFIYIFFSFFYEEGRGPPFLHMGRNVRPTVSNEGSYLLFIYIKLLFLFLYFFFFFSFFFLKKIFSLHF
jgi:hypothetical protein